MQTDEMASDLNDITRPERLWLRAMDWLHTLTHHREIARELGEVTQQRDAALQAQLRAEGEATRLRQQVADCERAPVIDEYPLDDTLLTRLAPALAREPNVRAKAPDWNNEVRTEVRRRRRATDWQPAKATPLGATRGDPCFQATRSRMDGSRRSGRLLYVKADRFDRATQAARELRKES